jgi:hypothetical protein
VHDRAAAETLNVGVLMYSPETSYLAVQIEPRFERLSRTFAKFDGESYRTTLLQLRESVGTLKQRLFMFPEFSGLPKDAGGVIRAIWPDVGLSFEAGPTVAGMSSTPLDVTLAELFGRMVSSQAASRGEAEHRSDEEVWAGVYQGALRLAGISHRLAPRKLTSPDFEIEFDHAFDNNRTHVVQPITMDFVRAESLQDKATKWVGTGTALKGHPKLGKFYLLIGEPRNEAHRSAYEKAKNVLHKMPVKHEIIEEGEAEHFAEELASYMKHHGVSEG